MDSGQMELQALQDQLVGDDRQAWLKFVLGPPVNGLSPLWCAQVIIGPRPDGWELKRWSYPECTFVSNELSVRQFEPTIEEVAAVHQMLMADHNQMLIGAAALLGSAWLIEKNGPVPPRALG